MGSLGGCSDCSSSCSGHSFPSSLLVDVILSPLPPIPPLPSSPLLASGSSGVVACALRIVSGTPWFSVGNSAFGTGLAPLSLLPCRGRFCSESDYIRKSGYGAGIFLFCCSPGLRLKFPLTRDWLSYFFGAFVGAGSPVRALCSVFLYINMYACVWCMCLIVV